ncbi:MAG: 2-hydroxyacyl-CoA dehydratase family protein [Candidatus Loosdrechtia sp.]|uniref:2-hydroxyacyl-CoA dehydratase family protein n=1 Tax=Candidatus Loosdrechtia sp. TaxID=3101272 RepID=UPI003A5D623E|nr:MAG: 2-hydroxyacyl-CoA dehydratase [Candidatus Jettenia sp. AMX2]
MNLKFDDHLLPTIPDMKNIPMEKFVGITSTIPIEIVFSAGYIPIDLNNIFICDASPYKMVEDAESAGLPRNVCAWIKGIYSAAIKYHIKKVISVVQGDCSNNQALMEVLHSEGIQTIPFAYPHSKKDTEFLHDQLLKLADILGVDYTKAEEMKKRLDRTRGKVHEIDRLTWKENKVTGEENHIWTVSASDLMGDYSLYEDRAERFLKQAKIRKPIKSDLRIGVIGIPPICDDLYIFLSSLGAHVVFNEIQRQFSMPYPTNTLVEQYSNYTYPYDVYSRLDDILQEIKQRNIKGIIHYVQSFCHRHIHDILIRKHISIPILTFDCDRPGRLDGAMKTRLEAFIEMLRNYRENGNYNAA